MQSLGLGLGLGLPFGGFDAVAGDPLALLDPDQALFVDSAVHYTTAQWPGFEHLVADRKPGVGTLRTPRAGRCWLFDGTDDYATRADSNLRPTGDFTITLWIKTDWTATDDGIVGAWSTTGYMLFRDSGVLRCYRDTNYAASSLNLNTAGYSNTWIHLAVVANGTSCKFYVNGSQFGTTQTFPTSTQAANGAVPFFIGAYGGPQGCIAGSIRDVRLYGTAKSDSEIAAIANQASTPGTYDTTSLLGAWWCEEESGTTGYDWSGNGRHLTLTNITQSTFHASDTGVTYSDANHRGYKASGSVVIPAINSTTAADSTALTYTGRCPQPGHVPQKCVKFDGTDDYASRTSDFRFTSSDLQLTVAAWVKCDAIASGGGVVATWNGSLGYACFFRSDVIRGYKDAENKGVSVSLSNGVWYHIVWVFSGTSFKGYLNGVQQGSTQTWVSSAVGDGGIDGKVGYYSAIGTNAHYQSNLRIWNRALSDSEIAQVYCGVATGDEYAYFPMCEGPGSSNTNTTIYDVSGNGRHLTISNSTPATFWGNNTDYTCKAFNYPIKYGWTLDGSGVVVPALLSGASDAAGNAIGQAAGAWSSGLQNVNTMPYTNPLGVNIGLETSLDPTANRKTASSSKRRRKNNSGRYTRFGARATAMSDANSNSYFGD